MSLVPFACEKSSLTDSCFSIGPSSVVVPARGYATASVMYNGGTQQRQDSALIVSRVLSRASRGQRTPCLASVDVAASNTDEAQFPGDRPMSRASENWSCDSRGERKSHWSVDHRIMKHPLRLELRGSTITPALLVDCNRDSDLVDSDYPTDDVVMHAFVPSAAAVTRIIKVTNPTAAPIAFQISLQSYGGLNLPGPNLRTLLSSPDDNKRVGTFELIRADGLRTLCSESSTKRVKRNGIKSWRDEDFVLEEGQTASLELQFTPPSPDITDLWPLAPAQAMHSVLTFMFSNGMTQELALHAICHRPCLTLSQSQLDFGQVFVGSVETQQLLISNESECNGHWQLLHVSDDVTMQSQLLYETMRSSAPSLTATTMSMQPDVLRALTNPEFCSSIDVVDDASAFVFSAEEGHVSARTVCLAPSTALPHDLLGAHTKRPQQLFITFKPRRSGHHRSRFEFVVDHASAPSRRTIVLSGLATKSEDCEAL